MAQETVEPISTHMADMVAGNPIGRKKTIHVSTAPSKMPITPPTAHSVTASVVNCTSNVLSRRADCLPDLGFRASVP